MRSADCDAPPSPRLIAEEDGRTTAFLETLPEECLIVDRRDLLPVAESKTSNINHVGPVHYNDEVYVLKEFNVRALEMPTVAFVLLAWRLSRVTM